MRAPLTTRSKNAFDRLTSNSAKEKSVLEPESQIASSTDALKSKPRPASCQSAFSGLKLSAESVAPKTATISKTAAKPLRIATNTASHSNKNLTPATARTASAPTSIPDSTSPGSASRPSSASKTALKPRDQNVTLVTWQQPLNQATMPTMRSNERSPNNGLKPQLPSLSAAAQRGIGRAPITPKIASKAPLTSSVGANTHTPLSRRTQRPTTANSKQSGQEDELPSLLSNITPRTGSRQSRVDSANSTPSGTPNPDRFDGWDRDSRSPKLDSDAPRRPIVTFSSILPELNGQARPEVPNTSESKFFYASDAKGTQQKPPPLPNPVLAKGPSFYYANGTTVENRSPSPAALSPGIGQTPAQDNLYSKFVYANGTPDLRPSPPPTNSRPGSVISTAPKLTVIKPGLPASGKPGASRPGSPTKLAQPPTLLPSRNGSLPPLATNRAQVTSPQLGPAPPALRRSSTSTSRGVGHSRNGSRNGSLVTGELSLRSSQISEASSPSVASFQHPAPLTLASIMQAAEDLEDHEDSASVDDSRSELQSPTKSAHTVGPASELIANARRERKVQDLQITNASLEAINRTLERQLRKQTAELRRFKRLSRSGRLPMTTTTIAGRVDSESLSMEPGAEGLTLSDLSEEGSEEDDLEEESLSDGDSVSESLSPSIMEERDAKYLKRDEKRLQIDLSKHQEVLIDSQKINQSIKRCLDWTEELIKEGKKALDYHVRVSDVAVRGRVLREDEIPIVPEELSEDTIALDEKFAELNDEITELERPPPRLVGWGLGPQYRDSGIELPPGG